MNILNIALIRATNVIPFDGVIHPVSNSRYLTKKLGGEFQNAISKLLEELKIMPQEDYDKVYKDPDYYDEYVNKCADITKKYLPLVSDYNSVVLFSLNGICPDDCEHGFGNNTFSDKSCAIIEPLKYHINETVSLVATDTAIKGDIKLSNEAIILIEENYYVSLSIEEKKKLNEQFKIKVFNGDLKNAINEELEERGYSYENLSLSSKDDGIKDSLTSDELKDAIKNIRVQYGLSNLKYFNLITARNGNEIPKYDLIKDDYNNALFIFEYYNFMFLNFLLKVMNAPEEMINKLSKNIYNKVYMKKITKLIKDYGIDKYLEIVNKYNQILEEKRSNGNLLTSEEIITETKKRKEGLDNESLKK